jgi:hypothetical protein
MSTVAGPQLTDALWLRLSGARPEAFAHLVVPLCTVDEGGWPHVALVSYSELRARDRGRIDILLYPSSGTSANLRQRRHCTLLLFDKDLAAYVKAVAYEYPERAAAPAGRAAFELRIHQVVIDAAHRQHEGDAYITSGVLFAAGAPFETARRQMRAALAALPHMDRQS